MAEIYGEMKKYAKAEQLSQEMVQAFVEKVVVTDPEHVEIAWKFSNEVKEYIGI